MDHRIRLACLAVVALLATLETAFAVSNDPSQPLHLYRMTLSSSELCSYAGRQYITTWSDDGRSSTVVAQVSHAAPDQYLLRFLAPKDRSGREILENRSYEWTFVPGRNVVIQTPRPVRISQDDSSGLLLSNYSITTGVTADMIADRKVVVVTLTSKSRHEKALRFWVDPYTGVPLRTERYHAGGDLAYVSYYSDIDYHPKFPDGLFTPAKWPGAKIDQQLYKARPEANLDSHDVAVSLQGRALTPDRIREYKLVGITRIASQSRPTLHLHYTDGLSSLSLFETLKHNRRATRMAGSRPVRISANYYGRISERFNYSLLNWDANRLSITLLGDLSPDTLVQLADAVTPAPPPQPAAPQRIVKSTRR